MSTQSGNVKITVQMVGQGDAPKKLQETTKAAKALEAAGGQAATSLGRNAKELAGVEAQAGGLSATVGTLREQFLGLSDRADKSVLKLRDGFNKIAESAGTIGAVVGAVGAGLVALFQLISRDRTLEKLREDLDRTLTKAKELKGQFAGLAGGLAAETTSQYDRENTARARARKAAEGAGDERRLAELDREQRIADAARDRDTYERRKRAVDDLAAEAARKIVEAEMRRAQLQGFDDDLQTRRDRLSAEDIKRQTEARTERYELGEEVQKLKQDLERFESERQFAKTEAEAANDRWREAHDDTITFDAMEFTPQRGGARAANDNRVMSLPWHLRGGPTGESERMVGGLFGDLLEEERRLATEWANTLGHDVARDILDGYQAEIEASQADIARLQQALSPANDNAFSPEVRAHLKAELERARANAEGLEIGPSAEQMRRDIEQAREYDAQRDKAQEFIDEQNRSDLATPIRDFSKALGEALPNMGSFGAALGQIAAQWDAYAKAGGDVVKTTVGTVAALARAGAEQIKNERARAAVLAVIEFGLGWASIAMKDYPAAAAHFTASAVLGTVAATSSGASASGATNSPQRDVMQTSQDWSNRRNAGPTIIINGYVATHSAQEFADQLWRRMEVAYGTGHGWQEAA